MFFLLATFFIPCVDDIHFSYGLYADSFSKLIHNVITYGNGRFLGNLCGMFFANHRILAALFRTAVLAGITECLQKLFCEKNLRHIIFIGVIVTSPYLFGDVIAWNSAFCNYIPPILLLLICLLLLKKYDYNKSKISIGIIYFVCIITSFCAQLFIEHNAIVNAFVFLVLSVFYFRKKDKKLFITILMLIASCAGGLVLVFAPHFIDNLNPDINPYIESFEFNMPKLLYNVIGMFSLTAKEIALDFAVCGFLSVCILIALKRTDLKKNIKIMLILSQVLYPIITVLTLFFYEGKEISKNFEIIVNIIRLAVCIIYVFGILFSVLYIVNDKKIKQIIVLVFCAAVVSLPPVSLSGKAFYRGTYIVHIAILIVGILFARDLKKQFGMNFKIFNKASAAAVIMLCVCIGLYSNQYGIYIEKEKSLDEQMNSKASIIYLPKLNEIMFHFPNAMLSMYADYGRIQVDDTDDLPQYEYMTYKEWKEFMVQKK